MIGNYVRLGHDTIGWRNTFFLVGLPGIFVALVIFFTLKAAAGRCRISGRAKAAQMRGQRVGLTRLK